MKFKIDIKKQAIELFFMASLLLASCQIHDKNVGTKPNVIIILTDDQGWGDVSIHGNTNLSTPNLDALSRKGASFSHFYVSPVCSPTRAEMLTGRYHFRMGVYSTSSGGERMDSSETSIAEVFKNAGYATAAYGKWHNGTQAPYHPNTRGFDDFYGFCSGHWGNYFSPQLEHNGRVVEGDGYLPDDLTAWGINFIEQNKNRPFFLYLPYNTPHSPMQVPDAWWNKFESQQLKKHHHKPEKEDTLHTKAALAMVENIDWNIGRIMQKLEILGLMENTIVVFFSDNGPDGWRWNDGLKGKKGSTDEGGVRSPLFIQWKGQIQPGIKIKEIAGAIDLLPTLAELSGINLTPTKPLDGMSLKPLLLGHQEKLHNRHLVNYWNGRISIRTDDYRLSHDGQLFNITTDPRQQNDLSKDESYILDSLLDLQKEWEKLIVEGLEERKEQAFTVGHPGMKTTWLPARDGIPYGNIKHSNMYPNCTFFTHWQSTADSMVWNIDVIEGGDYQVDLYYTCPEEAVGTSLELGINGHHLAVTIKHAHNPPLKGMENDRVPRKESYIKDFTPLNMGIISLEKGQGQLSLKAKMLQNNIGPDVRMLLLTRR